MNYYIATFDAAYANRIRNILETEGHREGMHYQLGMAKDPHLMGIRTPDGPMGPCMLYYLAKNKIPFTTEGTVTRDKEFLEQVAKDDACLLTFNDRGQEYYKECLSVLESLLYRITHGGIKGNPYTKEEVKRALQFLACVKGCEDWLNVPLNLGEE